MEIIGYVAAVLIGLSLGLIGGGGSIMTMPVLVYLFRVPPMLATSYSLIVVGIISLFGFAGHLKRKTVSVQTGLLFGTASVISIFLTRHFLLPAIPSVILRTGNTIIHFSTLTMILFALLMIAAAIAMIFQRARPDEKEHSTKKRPVLLLVYGGLIGLTTGLLGAGGGFLLIPALVLFARLPMKEAIGTSLMIITLNSFFGMLADLGHVHLDMALLLRITLVATGGLAAGMYLGRFIQSSRLKLGFAVFVLLMGAYMLITELIK
ncbi:sulfite exporter TauE/SafE family protein [Terrimonas sp. NA20]|uniref:Probable membrane transporter protein n=1 Tax=Terrimonas ginsenosidimutans TaxID=2908004 RepID=A0ABS9KVI4_9BACT|nr:sulfite exporter TauE/SafE family protein [Terrimonas ginsenosidimutans]MCG2616300.1 sulfite exporter TauE/SafE family protein [Terrimonas ginsenosidimutans]